MVEALALITFGVTVGASAAEVFRGRRLAGRLHAVALCSHELRGALTALGLGMTRLDRATGVPDRAGMEAVRHGHERALSVARDLEKALGRHPASAAQRPQLVDVRVVAGRVVEAWNARLGRSRVVLEWRAGAAMIHGYPTRLAQALDNLVANAVEHGRGQVTVTGRIAGRYVSVCVLDRGLGLRRPLDDLRPRSWRASRGHGLVVARHAVELHGGSLRPVRGPFGSGVEIRLPEAAGPTRVPVVDRQGMPRRSGSGAATP